MNQKKSLDKDFILLFTSWLVATVATLGSLFFSEVMGFIPCSLCWYQRIFMYPICIALIPALLKIDRNVFFYLYPMVILGLGTAFFHNLLSWGIISEELSPCVSGIPCSARYIEWGGFVTIPFLSLMAFIILLIIFTFSLKQRTHNEQ